MPKCSSRLNGSFGHLLINAWSWKSGGGARGKDLFRESNVWDQGRGGTVMDWPTNSADLVTRRSEGYQAAFNKEGLPDKINWPESDQRWLSEQVLVSTL